MLWTVVMPPSVSPLPVVARRERSASGSCRSTNAPDGAVARCTRQSKHQGRSAARRSCGRSFSGTPPGRTHPRRCDGSAHKFHSFAGSWSWYGCDQCPRRRDRAHIGGSGCRKIRCRDRLASATTGAVLVVEWHHPVVEDLGGGDRCLAIIQFGERDLGIGVDHGLLIDPTNALQGADIEGILGAAITRAFALELAMGFLVGLGFLEGGDLGFGQ